MLHVDSMEHCFNILNKHTYNAGWLLIINICPKGATTITIPAQSYFLSHMNSATAFSKWLYVPLTALH